MKVFPPLLVALALSSTGCVTKVRYDKLVAESAQSKLDAAGRQKDAEARIQALQAQIAAAEGAAQDREARLSDLSTQSHNVQAALDEQTAMNEQLRGELSRLGKDAEKILADKGVIAKALDDAKARLEELRKAQQASEARVALFKDFERRFKPLIDGGQIHIDMRRGQLTVVVPGDVLFDSGKSEVRGAGKGVLMEIARSLQLASSPAGRYVVTAHVDPVADPPAGETPKAKGRAAMAARPAEPHKGPHVRSAWELSADQAVAVVEYLASLGVPPASLIASGAGSFDPLSAGDDPATRMKNRRIEIALLPDATP